MGKTQITKKPLQVFLDNSSYKGIDTEKTDSFQKNTVTGIENFTLFQKYPALWWPAWLHQGVSRKSSLYQPVTPLNLVNTVMRDSISFTNFMSSEELLVDPAGMVSPSYGNWSIEFLVVIGGKMYRPAENPESVKQERDPATSVITTTWQESDFTLTATLFGAKSSIDEAILEINCDLSPKSKKAMLVLAVRPYDLERLGGLSKVEFHRDLNSISCNGRKSIHLDKKPDMITAREKAGRVEMPLTGAEKNYKSASADGMASLGAGFNLQKGETTLYVRVALTGREHIQEGKDNFKRTREDFTSYAGARIREGIGIRLPDTRLQHWASAAKGTLLNSKLKDLNRDDGTFNYRDSFFTLLGLVRTGYFTEALKIIDEAFNRFPGDVKKGTCKYAVNGSYLAGGTADYFVHTRTLDFLQSRYPKIKELGMNMLSYTRSIKKADFHETNSIGDFYLREGHLFDLILMAHAMDQFAYLARCIGIFGDEKNFMKESSRLSDLFISNIESILQEGFVNNEFDYYFIFAGFPFRLSTITDDILRAITGLIEKKLGEYPVCVNSVGIDVLPSLVMAANLISLRDNRGHELLESLMEISGSRYVLPEYLNPRTRAVHRGRGDSATTGSIMFAAIRNMIFIDYPERLAIFPAPREEWFTPGREIRVENAPSRFGLISFTMTATSSEVQLHFDTLPKFVPPDIMITLPFKTKIREEDDFILKKELGDSYVINGWPNRIRFTRKKS